MVGLRVEFSWFEKSISNDGANFFKNICTQLIFCERHTVHKHAVPTSHYYYFFFTIGECDSSSSVGWNFQIFPLRWEQFCIFCHLCNDSWRRSRRRHWNSFIWWSFGHSWCSWRFQFRFLIFLFTFWRSFSTASAGWVIIIMLINSQQTWFS